MEQSTITKPQFTFFWGGIFSQWYPSKFIINGITFTDAEMYMMYMKAMLFNDRETAEKILKATHPRESKKLGREVKSFNKEIWEENCKRFVYDGNYAKFTQNPELKKGLFNTGDSELVEASPEDKIWGIGLDAEHPDAQQKETWRGTNWLGEVLTQLRTDLRNSKPQKPNISFEEFSKLDIRICKILSVEKIANTDKLYKMQIDTGIDIRTVVSAIAHKFQISSLTHMYLPFILNLEPRKIKNIESTAMIILIEGKLNDSLYQLGPWADLEFGAQFDNLEFGSNFDKMLLGASII